MRYSRWIRKYGGVVIGLTIDEDGIPQTAEGRVKVAGKIIEEAGKYGIDKKDIVIDVLAMTISSEPEGAKVTLGYLKGRSGRLTASARFWAYPTYPLGFRTGLRSIPTFIPWPCRTG